MPPRRWKALATTLATVALIGAGCDSPEGTIPEQTADALLGQLELVQQAQESGDCVAAQAAAQEFQRIATEELPDEVDSETAQGLEDGATRLVELADPAECQPVGTTETAAEPEEDTTVPPPVEEETTTPTEETTTVEEDVEGEGEGPPEQPPGQGTVEPPGHSDDSEGELPGGSGGTGEG